MFPRVAGAVLIGVGIGLSVGWAPHTALGPSVARAETRPLAERLVQGSPWTTRSAWPDGRVVSFTLEFHRDGRRIRGAITKADLGGVAFTGSAVGELLFIEIGQSEVAFTSQTGARWTLRPTVDGGFIGHSIGRSREGVQHLLAPTPKSPPRDLMHEGIETTCREEIAPNAYIDPRTGACVNPDNTHR